MPTGQHSTVTPRMDVYYILLSLTIVLSASLSSFKMCTYEITFEEGKIIDRTIVVPCYEPSLLYFTADFTFTVECL